MRVVNIYLHSILNMTVIEMIISIDATILFIIESFIFFLGEKYNYVRALGSCLADVVIENIGLLLFPTCHFFLTSSHFPLYCAVT